MATLRESRQIVAGLLDTSSPIEAPTAYYGLYHDPKRSMVVARAVEGFVGCFQTGFDLFRPLVCMRCWRAEPAADLLVEALTVGRPYVFFANFNQLAFVGGSLTLSNERILSIYVLNRARFTPQINVLVIDKLAQDGTPRCEISRDGHSAVSGVNWQSPGFAEIYVHTDPEARRSGWGRSVAAAVTGRVLQGGRIPIYLVEANNEASIGLATSMGYVDTGARQVLADAVYQGHPNHRP